MFTPVLAKHTKNLTLVDILAVGMDCMQRNIDEAREFLQAAGIDVGSVAPIVQDKFISAFMRATKPASAIVCCGPTCCGS